MLLLILIDLLIDLFCWLQCFDAVCWATGHLLFKNFCFKTPWLWECNCNVNGWGAVRSTMWVWRG